MLKSYDAGATWTGLNTGLTGARVYTLAIDPHTPTTVYAGTDSGVFRIEQVAPAFGLAIPIAWPACGC